MKNHTPVNSLLAALTLLGILSLPAPASAADDIFISSTASTTTYSSGTFTGPVDGTNYLSIPNLISEATLSNVEVKTLNGNITVSENLITPSATNTITLNSGYNIILNADILYVNGRLVMTATNNLLVGYTGTSSLTINNSSSVNNFIGYIGTDTNSQGSVSVSGSSLWNNSGDLFVGFFGSGSLTINDSGSVNNNYSSIGQYAGSQGSVTVSGSGVWNNNGDLVVSMFGTGSLTINDSATVNTGTYTTRFGDGYGSTGNGTLNLKGGILSTGGLVKGDGSATLNLNGGTIRATTDNSDFFSNLGNLTLSGSGFGLASTVSALTIDTNGFTITATNNFSFVKDGGLDPSLRALEKSGSGTLILSGSSNLANIFANGGTTVITGVMRNYTGFIGEQAGQTATVTVNSSGFWNNAGNLLVGYYGTGSLTINNSGSVNSLNGSIGIHAGSQGTVTVSGSGFWNNSANLNVGYFGSGSLSITDSGSVNNYFGYVGYDTNSQGSVTVSGSGFWNNSGNLNVGNSGSGSLSITDSGSVNNSKGYIANLDGSQGSVSVSGSGYWNNSDNLYVGDEGSGSLSISDSGSVKNTDGFIAGAAGSQGSVNVSGSGFWNNTSSLFVGNSGSGSLSITNSGSVKNSSGHIGYYAGSQGSVSVSGSGFWNNSGDLVIGYSGSGSLSITNSGSVNNTISYIGYGTNSAGSVNVSGSGLWNNSSDLVVGYYGSGSLSITDNGLVNNTAGIIGSYVGSQGSVSVSGSGFWNNSGNLAVGSNGTGSLSISESGSVNATTGIIGTWAGGQGSVSVSGSGFWNNSSHLYVGYSGTGKLAIRDWGRVNVGGTYSQNAVSTLDVTLTEGRTNAYVLAQSATLSGTLNISGVSGTLPQNASEMGNNRATILQTSSGISGDFASIILGGGSSTADYATISAVKSSDGKNYEARLYLTWYTGTALAHGKFTVDGSFTVDLPLVDQSSSNSSGWDGKSLTKLGNGTLILSSSNSYSGGTLIKSGTLALATTDAIQHSAVSVDSGAVFNLGGYDQTVTSLTNNGLVDFKLLGHKLTISGNLSGNGDFRIDTDIAAGTADTIEVQGNSSGNHRLLITNSGNTPTGSEAPLRLVQTSDGVANFSGNVDVDNGMYRYNYSVLNGNALNLNANDWYLALTGSGGPAPAPVINPTGDAILNSAAAISGFWFTQMDNLNKRMGELRYNAPSKGDFIENVWIRSYGQQVNLNTGISGVKGFSETQYGVDLGTDKAWSLDANNKLYTGIFAGYGGADRDFHAGSNGSTDSGYGGLYGTWLHKDGWYADAVAKGQYFRNSIDGGDHAAYNSVGAGVSLELGRQFQFKDGWFAEPSVQVSYLHLMNDNYVTRQGLGVELDDSDVIQLYGGARLGRNFKLNDQGWLQPYVKVGGVEQISSGGQVRADGGQWRPTTDGARAVLGAGIVYQLDDRNQLHLDYEAAFGDKYDKPWGVNFGYRHQF